MLSMDLQSGHLQDQFPAEVLPPHSSALSELAFRLDMSIHTDPY